MMESLHGLAHGFDIALQWHNFIYCLAGVVTGQVVGVLPGLGPLAAISLLLPLTFAMKPVAAILMLAGIFYGSQYGGAICSILINLPCHPPHAVTCLDGHPLARQGKGGTVLAIAVIASFVGASFGITEMVFFSPILTRIAFEFGPAEICAIMLLGLLAGATLSRGSPLKGIAMTALGLLLGTVGTDVNTGAARFTFGLLGLYSGIEIVALALGLFGLAEFIKNVNNLAPPAADAVQVRLRDMRPDKAMLRRSLPAMVRGTLIGSLCSLIPGTGPTIASFVAYASEKRLSRHAAEFGSGAIEGVASPEAATHSSVQGDFIPTMCLGIPGDAVMALLLGALLIQGITPGPNLIRDQPDIFWGLIASFWLGNVLLVLLNVPLISLWVKLLKVPFRFLYPAALFFVCIGVYSANNSFFDVGEMIVIGIVGYGLMRLGYHPAPVLLGFVLGPRLEENFRRALLMSGGHFSVFVDRPISAAVLGLGVVVIVAQIILRRVRKGPMKVAFPP